MARPVKQVSEKHIEVAQLKQLGYTNDQIASTTGYSLAHIKSILANPEVKKFAASGESEIPSAATVEQVLDRAKLKAILLLENIINDSSELGDHAPTLKQRYDAATSILEMAGHGKNVKIEHSHRHILSSQDFERVRNRALNGPVAEAIEVTATPVEALPEIDGL